MDYSLITPQKYNSISARDLYEFLRLSPSQFTRWAKKNIDNNKFAIEFDDYVAFDIESNGREIVDYWLKLDFAKKLAMLANSEMGETAREYFIQCEKKAKQPQKELSRKDLALMIIESEERAEQLEIENKAKDRVIEDQNLLNGSILRMKATESRTTLKALKDDIGVEINSYVARLFKDTDSYRQKHVNAHELYRRITGKVYLGAIKSSLESKEDYLVFLKEQVAKLEGLE